MFGLALLFVYMFILSFHPFSILITLLGEDGEEGAGL